MVVICVCDITSVPPAHPYLRIWSVCYAGGVVSRNCGERQRPGLKLSMEAGIRVRRAASTFTRQ